MARTFQQIIEDHLGKVTFQSLQFAFQLEQAELRLKELTVPKARAPRKVKKSEGAPNG